MEARQSTAPRPAAVSAVLAQASTWISARRKSDGKPFFYIRGSKPGDVWMTAQDGCTCPSARNSRDGHCKHQEAVARYHERKAATVAPKPRVSYESLYPSCRVEGCDELVERAGERCQPHLADAVYRADRARQAELRGIAR